MLDDRRLASLDEPLPENQGVRRELAQDHWAIADPLVRRIVAPQLPMPNQQEMSSP